MVLTTTEAVAKGLSVAGSEATFPNLAVFKQPARTITASNRYLPNIWSYPSKCGNHLSSRVWRP